MQNNRQVQEGLRPTIHDSRNLKFGAVYWLPELSELPEQFFFDTKTRDQGDSDKCTAYMTCTMSGLQEEEDLDPDFAFMAGKKLSGDPEKWGQDLHTAMKAHVKIGALSVADREGIRLSSHDDGWLRDPESWPADAFVKATKHKKKTYFELEGPYDHFDNARGAIWKLRHLRTAIGFGVRWGYQKSTVVLAELTGGVGHAMTITGWKVVDGKTVLVVQNSLGEDHGEHGKNYITREVFNHYVEEYSAFLFTDMTKEDAKRAVKYGYFDTDSFSMRLIKILKYYVSK